MTYNPYWKSDVIRLRQLGWEYIPWHKKDGYGRFWVHVKHGRACDVQEAFAMTAASHHLTKCT